MAPDLANNDMPTTSQALDELLAAANQPKNAALMPENDEMVLDANTTFDAAKTDMYRAEVGQAPIDARDQPRQQPGDVLPEHDRHPDAVPGRQPGAARPGAAAGGGVGDNLLTFLANRLNMSFTNLACQDFGLTNPVTVTLNGQGVAIAATFNTAMQTAHNVKVTDDAGHGAADGPHAAPADEPLRHVRTGSRPPPAGQLKCVRGRSWSSPSR